MIILRVTIGCVIWVIYDVKRRRSIQNTEIRDFINTEQNVMFFSILLNVMKQNFVDTFSLPFYILSVIYTFQTLMCPTNLNDFHILSFGGCH